MFASMMVAHNEAVDTKNRSLEIFRLLVITNGGTLKIKSDPELFEKVRLEYEKDYYPFDQDEEKKFTPVMLIKFLDSEFKTANEKINYWKKVL
jgi:hypothetical protein